MILFTPVPAVATPETALAAIVTAIVTATGPSDASRATAGAGRASATAIATATGPSDASRATAATVHARVTAWLQYRVSHLTHFPSQFWSKGAAQTQQVVRIIVLLKPESL